MLKLRPKLMRNNLGLNFSMRSHKIARLRECLIVALEAFALDFVSSADRTHYTAFQVCTMADSRAVVADSRVAAGSVRYISAATDCPFSTSNSRLTGGFLA